MMTGKMMAARVLFVKTLLVWTMTMRERFDCCFKHSSAAFVKVLEMTDLGEELINKATLGSISEDEFCDSMSKCIREMEIEMRTLKKAEKIETSKEPFVLQKEARA